MPKNAAMQGVKRRFSPLWLPALLTLIFAGFTLLPRVNANPHLEASFLGAAGFLLAGLCALWWSVARTGRTLTYEFVPRRVHWVQMIMHSCVFAYWGWYWREVYHEIPLIAAQVVFLYVLDMLVCWSRRDNWILGFGPDPYCLQHESVPVVSRRLVLPAVRHGRDYRVRQGIPEMETRRPSHSHLQSLRFCPFPDVRCLARHSHYADHLGRADFVDFQ